MKTINSISGGKTSAYLMANYEADFNVFSLVRTNDPDCRYKGDDMLYQYMCDKLQLDWNGTLEMDTIIQTIYDLEQFTGKEIHCVTGKTFDDVVATGGGMHRKKVNANKYLPNKTQRFCTEAMKLEPITWFIYTKIGEPVKSRIGFRANEKRRAKSSIEKQNKNGFTEIKIPYLQDIETKRFKWKKIETQHFEFPLIDDNIFKDQIQQFWSDKPVKFASHNNCVGCFHRSPIFLRKMFDVEPEKMQWFNKQEKTQNNACWRSDIKYEKIKNHKMQTELSFDDFSECDSGYCGL